MWRERVKIRPFRKLSHYNKIKVEKEKADGFHKYLDNKAVRSVSHGSRKERWVCRRKPLNVRDGFQERLH